MGKDKKGLFISFEGGEGAGKSTQIRHLVRWLKANQTDVLLTLEPGGSRIGKRIRELLLNPSIKNLSERAELLLYEADRAQHVEEILLPALAQGKVVISDRYADSSTVYQGICRGLGLDWTEQLNAFATQGLFPDLVIVLDIPETIGLRRVQKRVTQLVGKRKRIKMDRLEREKQSFHRKVRSGFLLLSKRHPKRFRVLDARQSPEAVSKAIQNLVKEKMREHHLRVPV